MQPQMEITQKTPLLDDNGSLVKPGFCRTNLYVYRRNAIRANPFRIKEWDFYQVTTARYTVQVILADISMGGFGSVSVFDMETGERCEHMEISLLTRGKLGLAENDDIPHQELFRKKDFRLRIVCEEGRRHLRVEKPGKIDVCIHLELMPQLEYLTMAVPFPGKPQHFYLNKKMNSMPASGHVKVGNISFTLNPETDFAVLDWGRGVWPYRCSWYWGNGTHRLPDGSLFGFEIGWGFGDMSAASENMLFYNGKAHKIEQIYLDKDATDWMKPWRFRSSDGRFEMTMDPTFDNYTSSRIGPVGNQCHQVFGKWNGAAILDDGTKLEIQDMLAFCEFSDNRW